MNIWNIYYDHADINLEVGACTLVMGQHSKWFEMVRKIDEFFNSRSTDVVIEEDAVPVLKKDWKCFFIPYDAHLQLDKITLKSPLNMILNEVVEQYSATTAFMELQHNWFELQEELFFINESINRYNLHVQLKDITESDLRSFLTIRSAETMSPFEYKLLMLRLIRDQVVDKRTLIMIELPELFAGQSELEKLVELIKQMLGRGFRFILVTSRILLQECPRNFLIGEQIVNRASIEWIRQRIMIDAPFGLELEDFEIAKEAILTAVDNSLKSGCYELDLDELEDRIRLIALMIIRHLKIPINIDTHSFPTNIKAFLEKY